MIARSLLAGALACMAAAQSRAVSLSGSIVDDMGGPVIAAKLTLRGETSRVYVARSNEQGLFSFTRVVDDSRYTLAIDQAGFCPWTQSGLRVPEGRTTTLPRIILKTPNAAGQCD